MFQSGLISGLIQQKIKITPFLRNQKSEKQKADAFFGFHLLQIDWYIKVHRLIKKKLEGILKKFPFI